MDERQDGKRKALREHGTLNVRASEVKDPLFQNSEFFDPQDLVLVKYEMLRRVRVEGSSVAAAARAFGFSRVAFYQAMAAFQKEGLPGLLPRRRGPKAANKLTDAVAANKLTDAVLEFIDRQRAADSSLRAPQLAVILRKRLHLVVHPRSIERALTRRAKKGRQIQSS
jgi:transposase-like protein